MFQFESIKAETHIILYLNKYTLGKLESKVLIVPKHSTNAYIKKEQHNDNCSSMDFI